MSVKTPSLSHQVLSNNAFSISENLYQKLIETGEAMVINGPGGKNLVVISESEFNSILETLYVLRSPANSTRLWAALNRAKSQVLSPQTIEEICQKFDLDIDQE